MPDMLADIMITPASMAFISNEEVKMYIFAHLEERMIKSSSD